MRRRLAALEGSFTELVSDYAWQRETEMGGPESSSAVGTAALHSRVCCHCPALTRCSSLLRLRPAVWVREREGSLPSLI